ncbi:MAG: hypothetical protein IKS41_06890 [Alphaproteobacteria bacterium]|nr:hypothetical protein [Alphaproteobacteria bacterium]
MKKQGIDIFLLIRDQEEVYSAFVTLASVCDRLQSISLYQVHLFSLFEISQEIKEEFLNLSEALNIDFQVIDNMEIPSNRLNLLFYILQNFSFREHVIYLNNNMLILSDISGLFKNKGTLLFARKDEENYSIDTNVMLFNHKEWLKAFRKYPAHKKQVSAEVWNVLMWNKTKDITLYYNYPASQFNHLSDRKKIKILQYDMKKPWTNPEIPFGHLWWRYLRGSNFYEIILFKCMPKNSQNKIVFKKVSVRKVAQKKPDKLYPLAKEYIKEGILYLITAGDRAQDHKNKLILLQQKIFEKAG